RAEGNPRPRLPRDAVVANAPGEMDHREPRQRGLDEMNRVVVVIDAELPAAPSRRRIVQHPALNDLHRFAPREEPMDRIARAVEAEQRTSGIDQLARLTDAEEMRRDLPPLVDEYGLARKHLTKRADLGRS